MVRRIAMLVFVVFALHPQFDQALTKELVRVAPLSQGLHLGYGTFAPVSGAQLETLGIRVSEAVAAGLNVSRIMVDWSEIERTAGEFDRSVLDDQLARTPSGTRLFLTLGVVDVDRYSVPADLLASDGSLNTPLDDPDVVDRYLSVMDEILPELIGDFGLFAISVANEPDVLLAENSGDGARALAAFANAVNKYADDAFPGLAVTMTISGGGVVTAPEFVNNLLAATDVAAFNWGCIDLSTFRASKIEQIPNEIDQMLRAANGRDVFVQELSCPSGYTKGSSSLGSTPEFQAEWFRSFFAAMADSPTFRVAFVFDLVDWPVDLAAAYSDFLRAEGLDEIANRYEELQRTWGLLTFDDLAPKPAWFAFLEAVGSNTI